MRLAAERLLGDEGVGTDSAGVDLVRDKVAELEHVDVTDDDIKGETVARAPVVKRGFAVEAHPFVAGDFFGVLDELHDLRLRNAIENRGGNFHAERPGCDAKMGFKNLPDIHAGRNAQRVEADVHRSSVFKEGHVLLGHNGGHDAFVAVASGHFVTDGKLSLAGNENTHLLHHAVGAALVTGLDAVKIALALHVGVRELLLETLDDVEDLVADRAGINFDRVVGLGQLAQHGLGDLFVGADDDLASLAVDHIKGDLFIQKDVAELLCQLLGEILLLGAVILFDLFDLLFGLRRGELFLVGSSGSATLGHADIHDDAGAA